jgi:hypothetical protein
MVRIEGVVEHGHEHEHPGAESCGITDASPSIGAGLVEGYRKARFGVVATSRTIAESEYTQADYDAVLGVK